MLYRQSEGLMEATRGVYFLANDKVYDLAIAFLNSFRLHNKEISLCLIPYDQKFETIASLKDEYDFTIFDSKKILDYCDDVSIKFHGKQLGAYRKLAAWEGDFDEFVYIDLDTVVLDSIDFSFEYLKTYSVFTSHSNVNSLVKWVWKESIYAKNILNLEQIKYSANTGFFVSKKNLFSMELVLSKVDSALQLKDDMVLFCMEQPFLNYLIVTSGHNYSSITQMFKKNWRLKLKFEYWAGIKGAITIKGRLYVLLFFQPFFLVHWAGLWQPVNDGSRKKIPYKKLWDYYRNLNPKYSLPIQDKNNYIFSRFFHRIKQK